ncbi:MAG: ferritin family protein [Phycisphaerae bacterium]|nr:ferritin family protein [Phycisphaerae bacterium]MDD5380088.1 ferritin family protein [Phycisphaerae bacterium]
MSITFNADEIFEMAENLERDAARFYHQAAKGAADKKTKQMFLDLANMEDRHLATFQEMRKELGAGEKEETVFDPDNEAAMYLQTMARGHGWEGKRSPTGNLTGNEKIEDILKIALEAERNSVVFYSGLKELVPPRAGRDRVEAIIKEELGHIAILNEQLALLN